MCFSAGASFTAAGVVTATGAASVGAAKRRAELFFAVIPLIFAFHQAAEGFVWLGLSDPRFAGWLRPAMYTFLGVGRVVWPVWVPLAILAVESESGRRKLLTGLLVFGALLAPAIAFGLATYPVSASITGHHIEYHLDSPQPYRLITDRAYVVATVAPPLLSSSRMIRWLGVLVLLSLIVSKLLFYATFISVWCFFAAVISALIVVVLRRRGRQSELVPGGLA